MRIRQHVNPTLMHFTRFRGDVPTFGDLPVEVEIGCADAQFLFERAAANPAQIYVGLEIREDLVTLVNRRAKQRGVPVHAVLCQAQLHMATVFPPGRVDRVFINFPDPWFKRRHQDRRMVDDTLANQVAMVTRSGADIFVQTDIWDLALEAMATFDGDPLDRFVNRAGEWTFWKAGNPYGVRSWREQNAEETGLPIWRIAYYRR